MRYVGGSKDNESHWSNWMYHDEEEIQLQQQQELYELQQQHVQEQHILQQEQDNEEYNLLNLQQQELDGIIDKHDDAGFEE